ncbi:DUF4396 domain-containing protein [Candidatus Halobonum tyrrellensis]|uniref:DUF4396 domain-containing protein n=1 Tax=Candidatus Halobonum tyrrellensis G22 TaxID=1324957 RepID=V4J358_9EURY|nr:DUF4396 domain-containing protein [Candidatus Halobonum tyrrellensis]ESP89817.1 hypothetical protein K933_02501 [Candidatus Halobonum tyrrellensis G22]
MSLRKNLAVVVAGLLVVVVAAQPLYVVALTLFDYGHQPGGAYATMQTKDTTRFPASDPDELSAATARAARPPNANVSYDTVVRVPEGDWRTALAASGLRAAADAIVLYGDAPVPGAGNGSSAARTASTVELSGGNSAAIAARIATRGNTSDEVSPNNVVLVGNESPEWALPAAAWSAYSGDPILYVDRNGVPDATRQAIAELNATHAYVLAPPRLVGRDALSALDTEWTRVAGSTPQDHAVEIAKFRDESRDFGWGIDDRDKVGYYNTMLVNPDRPEHAVASTNLQWGKAGPVLLVHDDGTLPAITENFLWRTQSGWFSTPAEGPFNHVFVLGSLDDVSWVSQTRSDYAVEVTPYRLQGAGMSPLDALSAVWAAFSLLGATFVYTHSRHRIPEMGDWTKLVWPLFTLLLGPIGLGFYWFAYRSRETVERDGRKHVVRPYWLQAASATAMGVGFAASTMVAVAFLLTYFGMPLVVFDGPLFALGSSMVLTMAIVYVVALLVSWQVFHVPMFEESMGLDRGAATRQSLLAVVVSMTSVSVGMMTMMWVLMMLNLPMMPGDDNVLWFGVMVFSTLVGFLIAWPVNGLLVRRNVKPGGAL